MSDPAAAARPTPTPGDRHRAGDSPAQPAAVRPPPPLSDSPPPAAVAVTMDHTHDEHKHQPTRGRARSARLHACAPLLVIAAVLALGGPPLSSRLGFCLLPVSGACSSSVPRDQWVTAVCSGSSDAAFAPCTRCPFGHYETSVCDPGEPASRLGRDMQSRPCSSVAGGEFVTKECDNAVYGRIGADLEKKNCTAPALGAFITRRCSSGDRKNVGSDTQQRPCAVPTPSQFIRKACRPGSWAAIGYDSDIGETPAAPSGQLLALQVSTHLSLEFPVDSLISSAVLAPIVRRAFDQQLGGEFLVTASSEFISRGIFSVRLLVNATSSAGVTEIVVALDLLVRLGSAHPVWQRIEWPNQQAPTSAEINLNWGVAEVTVGFVDEPDSTGPPVGLIVGVVIDGVVLIAIVAIVCRHYWQRAKGKVDAAGQPQASQSDALSPLQIAWLRVRTWAAGCGAALSGGAKPEPAFTGAVVPV